MSSEQGLPGSQRAPTIEASGRRRWLYPDRRSGKMQNTRRNLAVVLICVYLITPFLSLGPELPLLRLDVEARIFYAFGLIFHMNDMAYIAFGIVALLLMLFLVTSLKGRLWCGYACPQTVFLDWLIRPIEEFFEGSAHKRRRQDSLKVWPLELWLRKAAKHLCFVVVSAIIANAFLAYLFPYEKVFSWMLSPPWQQPGAFALMSFVLAVFYWDLAWFREQFCAFLCPYARFQSVMMDNDTPAVAYDFLRGEKRGKRGKDLGDCIDCGLCVRVCPTGIDIRDGLQMECIQCMRCADACDSVMGSLGRELGLIRSASPHQIEQKTMQPFWKRPRVWVYGLALALISTVVTLGMMQRQNVDAKIFRQPGSTYQILPDGRIANHFQLQLINYSPLEQSIELAYQGSLPIDWVCPGCNKNLEGFERRSSPLILSFDPTDLLKGDDAEVHFITEPFGQKIVLRMLAPRSNPAANP